MPSNTSLPKRIISVGAFTGLSAIAAMGYAQENPKDQLSVQDTISAPRSYASEQPSSLSFKEFFDAMRVKQFLQTVYNSNIQPTLTVQSVDDTDNTFLKVLYGNSDSNGCYPFGYILELTKEKSISLSGYAGNQRVSREFGFLDNKGGNVPNLAHTLHYFEVTSGKISKPLFSKEDLPPNCVRKPL